MARPERYNCDYFPFYAKDGRTLFLLESKYNCKGTGFFTNLMRFLTMETHHVVNIQDESDRLYFFSKCKCDEESGIDMLNIMSKTGKINKELWAVKVIASQDLLDSLKDAYKNRRNKIITMEELILKYVSSPNNPVSYQENLVNKVSNTDQGTEKQVSGSINPQTKLKETKGKDIKEQESFPETPKTENPLPEPKKEAAPPPAGAGQFKIFGGSHFSNKAEGYLKTILDHAQAISLLNNKNPPFNVYKFIQFHFKNKTHPGAMMETLAAIKDQWKEIKSPWSYGMTVIKTKNGNWYEKDAIKSYQDVDQAWDNFLKTNPAVKQLLNDALKTV